ncbi:MAG: hypothetical protein Q9181_004460 [Wetmoreana brouardii]
MDGTPDGVSTSEATSMDALEDAPDSYATPRYHFEHLTVPTTRAEQRWPSAASFDASLDRLDGEIDGELFQMLKSMASTIPSRTPSLIVPTIRLSPPLKIIKHRAEKSTTTSKTTATLTRNRILPLH